MSEQEINISFCEKIKRLFVSSSCCNKTEIHNETIIIKKSNTEKQIVKDIKTDNEPS
jgi:hypothetical protein